MLRALVLLMLVVNAGLYYWLHADPQALQPDREPQRLEHQISPDAVQVLPDLPTGAAPAASAASQAAAVDAAPPASSPAQKTAEADAGCAETPPLDDARFAELKAALARGGVPGDAIAERREVQGAWIIYLGRFPDAPVWQQKADELSRLDVKWERVTAPPTRSPGLSLGHFASEQAATQRLAALTKRGVHGARVVAIAPPVVLRHLQVRATDPAWHRAAGAQRFDSCSPDASDA